MVIRISQVSADKAFQILSAAMAMSYRVYGAWDDAALRVAINGIIRPVRRESIRQVSGDSLIEADPGPMPLRKEVRSFSVFSSSAHFGGHSRARAQLSVFARSGVYAAFEDPFLHLDIAEVGQCAGTAPFHAFTVLEALCQAEKKVYVETLPGFTEEPFRGLCLIAPSVQQYENGWFQGAVAEAVKVVRHILRINGLFDQETYEGRRAFQILDKEEVPALVAGFWRRTRLGVLLEACGHPAVAKEAKEEA